MSTQLIKMTIQFRRDTTENWLLYKDKVPAAGEPCFDMDLKTLKIGDGTTTYENLPVIGGAGVNVSADGKSVVLEDGIFKLAGFDAAEVGAQPRKNADGNIEWIVPSTETAEGLATTVASLQTDVANLQKIVGDAEGDSETLIAKIAALKNDIAILNSDVDVEGSVKKTVTDEINTFATNITEDGVVNSFKELVDYVAEHGGEAADMAANITTLQELVGEVPVSSQISEAISAVNTGITNISVNGESLEVVEGQADIPMGAGLKESEEITVAEDGTLGVGFISAAKLVNEDGVEIMLDGGSASN